MKFAGLLIACMLMMQAGCTPEDVLTKEEIATQSAADYQVANLLFDHDLSANASYKVKKDGSVLIVFDPSVSFERYNDIVQSLRANKAISGVRAEQEGVEVCPLR